MPTTRRHSQRRLHTLLKSVCPTSPEFDLALEEMGIAALAANAANQEARKKLEKETTRMKKQLAEEEEAKAKEMANM